VEIEKAVKEKSSAISGQEYEKALIALLKALPAADQHQLQKIVEIVVISNQP